MKRKLNEKETEKAKKLISANIKNNPLRRVRLSCSHGWLRDPQAMVKDWIWCEFCNDFTRVLEVVQ